MHQLIAYLVATLGITLIGVGAIVTLEIARPGGDWNSNTTTVIIGMITPTLAVLIGVIKSIGNAQAIEKAKEEVKSHIDTVSKGS